MADPEDVELPKLSRPQFVDLLLCMGYAMAAAQSQGDYQIAQKFMHLANKVNEGNPHFTPYQWDDEKNEPKRMWPS